MSCDYLRTAAAIGSRLSKAAIWSGRRCTWRVSTTDPERPESRQTVERAAGGTLYQGSAGIGLFLTELYGLTGDAEARRTAAAALHGASDYAATLGPNAFGFYSGRVGIAVACARFAAVTHDDEFIVKAHEVMQCLRGRAHEDSVLDVVGGAAGAIPALLQASFTWAGSDAFDLAMQLGDHLVARAERGPLGWSWRSQTLSNVRNLTGFAHGAAGQGHALLELYAATGLPDFRYGAEQAFLYERSAFSPESQNWLDLRHDQLWQWTATERLRIGLREMVATGRQPGRYTPRYMAAWCHGAAGIGLTRLRAFSITGTHEYREETMTALRATLAALTATRGVNYSLCHGVLGNCELLLAAADAGVDPAAARGATDLADQAMDRYEFGGLPWPSGVSGGIPDPSLMLGDAGIGHFYLRLADNSIPSVLFTAGQAAPPQVEKSEVASPAAAADVEAYFGRTLRGFAQLGYSPCLTNLEAANPIAKAARAVKHLISDAQPAVADRLRDVARVDLARYELSATPMDDTAEFLDVLRWEVASGGGWTEGSFALSPRARVIQNKWNWDAPEATGTDDEHAVTVVVYRSRGKIHTQQVGPLAGLIFRCVSSPARVDQILASVAEAAGGGAIHLDEWRSLVVDQLRSACEAGIVVWNRCEGPQASAPETSLALSGTV